MEDSDGDRGYLEQFKHPDIVNTVPTLKDLMKHTSRCAADWKEIGTLLGLRNGELKIIEYEHSIRVRDCWCTMLAKWLEDIPNASWGQLISAIESLAKYSSTDKAALVSSNVVVSELDQFRDRDKVNTTPLLPDLKEYFTPQYAADWKEIGIMLGVDATVLAVIEENYNPSATDCSNAMLTKWLEIDNTASWGKLLTVVESPPISTATNKDILATANLDHFRDKVHIKPSLKELHKHFTPKYGENWKIIGTMIDIPLGVLDIIEHDYRNTTHCCIAMWREWLQRDTTASWGKLLNAIESAGLSNTHDRDDYVTQVTTKLNQFKYKGNESPQFKDLYRYVTPHYAAHWREIGVRLGLSESSDTLKKLYYQAKHRLGTEELQLYKLVIFGPPGVGKSSLFQVLLGKDPDPVRNSTGVFDKTLVQVKVAITRLADQTESSWDLISIEDEISRLRSTIKRIIDKPKQTKVDLSAAATATAPSVVIDPEKSQLEVEKKLFQYSTKYTTKPSYASSLMACYDSGGQPEFFDIMPALMTIPTGNIMVFDLSKDINSKIDSVFYEKGECCQLQHQAHYTTAELMKTAIANIQSYSRKGISDFSIGPSESITDRLLVVGTHLDKLLGKATHEKLQKVDQIETMMLNDVLAGEAKQMVHCDNEGRMIHSISNTDCDGRAEAAQKIRTAIEDMSKCAKSYSQVPINWLLFQLEVQLTGKDYIGRSKCIEISENCYIKNYELDYVLKYFHDLGVILHYREVDGLQNVVFCNPQWLFNLLTELIKLKYKAAPKTQMDINKGIFSKQCLYSVCYKKLDKAGDLEPENLLALFIHLRILSKLPYEPEQYFMPALLNPAPMDLSLQEEYGVRVQDTMLVKFENRHFPRGMFCCLVTHLTQSDWKIQFKYNAYKNLIVFQNLSNQYVVLFDKISHIAIELRCKKGSHLQANHYDVCDEVFRSLNKLCRKFKMNNDFKFGFACNECERFAGVELRYAISRVYFCESCQTSFQLNDDQLIWFLPPDIFKSKTSALQQQPNNAADTGHTADTDILEHPAKQPKAELTSVEHNPDPPYYSDEPRMWDLIKIVIPEIKSEWRYVAYSMQYKTSDINGIEKDCSDSAKRCEKLFENWLATPKGITPKTWRTLLKCFRDVDELTAATDRIDAKLNDKYSS